MVCVTLCVLAALVWRALRPVENYTGANVPRFAGSFAPATETVPATYDARQIAVVSWNIKFAEQIETAIAELRAAPDLRSADVFLLQEMDERGSAAIARALGLHYVFYPASIHTYHGRNFGNAVLSRWPIVASEKVILPHANPKNGQIRIAVRAVLAVGQTTLTVYSVHTETYWLGPDGRRAQIAALAEAVADESGPVIVGGDFNTLTAGSLRAMQELLAAAGLAPAARVSFDTVHIGGAGFALDHIFSRGVTVVETLVHAADGSDHAPLSARLVLPPVQAIAWVPSAFLPAAPQPR